MYLQKPFFLTFILLSSSAINQILGKIEIEQSTGEWCPSWKNLQCGSDGITYWNECLFNKNQNGTLNIVAGTCDDIECQDCETETEDLHICTTAGRLFKNRCMLDCFRDEYPHATEDFKGCKSQYPKLEEFEKTTTELLLDVVENYLNKSLTIEIPDSGELEKTNIDSFEGIIQHSSILYLVRATRGWMQSISVTTNTGNYFYLSSQVPGRFLIQLIPENIKAGYKYFVITSGSVRKKTPLEMNIRNTTIQLVADFVTDRYNCTRIVPVRIEIIELPNLEIRTQGELMNSLNIPIADLEGFFKEHFIAKVNKAIEQTLFHRMNHVGCLTWPSDNKEKEKCFGAFQKRFCMA